MNDISNKEDVKVLVDRFYEKVRADELIGPIFNSRIADDKWSIHLERMYTFWNTILFDASEYKGNPFQKHIPLKIDKSHFDRWLLLFESVLTENFKGVKADEALMRAQNIAHIFEQKLKYMRD